MDLLDFFQITLRLNICYAAVLWRSTNWLQRTPPPQPPLHLGSQVPCISLCLFWTGFYVTEKRTAKKKHERKAKSTLISVWRQPRLKKWTISETTTMIEWTHLRQYHEIFYIINRNWWGANHNRLKIVIFLNSYEQNKMENMEKKKLTLNINACAQWWHVLRAEPNWQFRSD